VSRRVQRSFGARLKEARKGKLELQKVLGDRLSLSRTSISNIERGTHRVFLDQVYAAAHALGVDIADLLPPLSDIYAPVELHTPFDDPLSDTAAAHAKEVALTVQQDLTRSAARSRAIRSAHRKER